MKKILFTVLFLGGLVSLRAEEVPDSLSVQKKVTIEEVVVTGTRNETDVRHLPMTVSVVNREQIELRNDPSLLPLLTEYIPGLFTTSRGLMGYGVSGGAAGGMSLRGIGGVPQEGLPTTGMLVLIDGHPQYMGLMGHPISRCLPVFAGGTCRSAAGSGVCVIRVECDGGSDQYCNPEDATGWNPDTC